jgi:hypothetical protein
MNSCDGHEAPPEPGLARRPRLRRSFALPRDYLRNLRFPFLGFVGLCLNLP